MILHGMKVKCDMQYVIDEVEIVRESSKSRTVMSHAFSWWAGILYRVMVCMYECHI